MLIINDLSGNKIGNKSATDRQHFAPFRHSPSQKLYKKSHLKGKGKIWMIGLKNPQHQQHC
jgi:hypothetical protein